MNRHLLLVPFLVITALLVGCGSGDAGLPVSQTTPTAQPTVGFGGQGGLLTSSRAMLSVCVDGAGGGVATAANVDDAATALDSVFDGNISRQLSYPLERSVSLGCPPATALTGEVLGHVALHDFDGGGILISPPNPPNEHRVFVYVVPDAAYAQSFGEVPYATGTAEFLCYPICSAVTTSLYVTPSATTDILREGLIDALGLRNRRDPPRDPTEVERKIREALGTPVP